LGIEHTLHLIEELARGSALSVIVDTLQGGLIDNSKQHHIVPLSGVLPLLDDTSITQVSG
jgi:hypothetical protein